MPEVNLSRIIPAPVAGVGALVADGDFGAVSLGPFFVHRSILFDCDSILIAQLQVIFSSMQVDTCSGSQWHPTLQHADRYWQRPDWLEGADGIGVWCETPEVFPFMAMTGGSRIDHDMRDVVYWDLLLGVQIFDAISLRGARVNLCVSGVRASLDISERSLKKAREEFLQFGEINV